MYSKEVLKHFKHPHNMGEIKNPDGLGKIGNPVCGDMMYVYLRISKNKDGKPYIKDIKVKTFGCIAAIATSSVLTDIVKGKTIEDALKISNQNIIDIIHGLPPQKLHCSVLAEHALKEAIYDYLSRNNLPIPQSLKEFHERMKKSLG